MSVWDVSMLVWNIFMYVWDVSMFVWDVSMFVYVCVDVSMLFSVVCVLLGQV